MAEAVSVIIIAGGGDRHGLARSQGVAHPSLVKIAGRSIIAAMVEAFQGAPGVAEVIVVSAPEVLAELPREVGKVAAGGAATENISRGLFKASKDWVIIAPGDMPWLSSAAVGDFLTAAQATGADLVYPIVSQQDYNARYPGGRRTYVTLREGTYTGGNLVLARRSFLQGLLPLIHRLFEYRKNPLLLARVLGVGFVVKMLLKRLEIRSIEQRARQLTGGRAVALPIARPELAFDVDRPEDLAAALALAASGGMGA